MKRPLVTAGNVALEDAEAFTREVGAHRLFDLTRNIVIARAPGRLDLMGGIADYSGSLVLQWPLHEATLAAVQIVPDGRLQVRSLGSEPEEIADRRFEASIDDLFRGGYPLDYEAARSWFADRGDSKWAAYVLGALIILARERGVRTGSGLRVLIRSAVPEGKGVGSSAALEVAVMKATAIALGVDLIPRDLALLSQIVENRVVGAACGVMDQMTAACALPGQLLALLCQPCELRDPVALPAELEIFGLDSGVRHSVSGSDYESVRIGAFMGARILAGHDPKWSGYLANVPPSEFERGAGASLPETMSGADFQAAYGATHDSVTQPRPDRAYAVRAPTAHPVHEHARVQAFAELLKGPITERTCELLGELMYQSHASYSACGLGSNATDAFVAIIREAGPKLGFLGAKITGGGSGGTVAVLARKGASIGSVVKRCAQQTGHRPQVFAGSSPGAAAFGSIRLGPAGER